MKLLQARLAALGIASLYWLIGTVGQAQMLPAVPFPAENSLTEEKRILGKLLFWEEQLSSDGSVACGTCHAPAAGGSDPEPAVHPGADLIFGNSDDVFGSFGVARLDVSGIPVDDPVFGFDPQVTGRAAPNFFAGIWAPENFWDGRAGGVFLDPILGTTLIASGGALENQAIGPILNDVEMAKEGRTWQDVTHRLESVVPLAGAANLPADMLAALAVNDNYPDLFAAAFSDPAITPARIAFAIATYERTLVADQTPWDAFVAGDATALTPNQQIGWTFFSTSPCAICHPAPQFTNDSFRNIGVRAPTEDAGRSEITGAPMDLGRFKVPSLRNAALKAGMFHTGQAASIPEAITFYQPGNQGSIVNIDPLLPVPVPPNLAGPLTDFLVNGLVDPRVAAEAFPFDRPTLVPEPTIGAMLIAGEALLIGLARRRRINADSGLDHGVPRRV